MAENCFTGETHEHLDNCPNEEISAGISVRIQYTPERYIETMTLPSNDVPGFEEAVTIAADGIQFKEGRGWKGIDLQIDENELKDLLVGNRGNKKSKSELSVYIPKFIAKTLGWKKKYKNEKMVLNIPDSLGVNWIMGTKQSPATIDSADSTTGKAYEDNAGTPVTFMANTGLYRYLGDVVETPDTTTTTTTV